MTRRAPRPATTLGATSPALTLPPFARVVRGLEVGVHPYTRLLPHVGASPALRHIVDHNPRAQNLVAGARVRVSREQGYAYIDDAAREIVLAESYYRTGAALDLYLDLLHELTHLRQLDDGHDLWDERFAYPDRPTEVEGYAVAVAEGRRLGMTEAEIVAHLSNPWMSAADVRALYANVQGLLRRTIRPHRIARGG